MPIATLSIDLEARLARLEQDMGKATRLMEREAGKIERAFGGVSARLRSSLAGIFAGLSAGAVTAAFASVVRGIDNLNDMADATGSTVENLSALEDIAARTGTSVETVSTAMVKFNAQVQEGLKPGSEAARVFERLGLNAKELAAIDPAEALVRTARALAQFADDGDKARGIYLLFGKSTREVAPLLKDLAEAGQLNATITAEQAAAAEKFSHEMSRMQKNILDVGRAIGLELIPKLNNLFVLFRGLPATTEQASDSMRVSIYKMLAAMLPLPAMLVTMRAASQAASTAGTSQAGAGRGFVNPALVDPRQRLGTITEPAKLKGAGRGERELAITFGNPLITEVLDRIDRADEAKLAKLREEMDAMVRIVQRGGEVPNSAFAAIAEDIAKLDPAARAAADAAREMQRIFDETRTPAEALNIELARLQKLLDDGVISWDLYGRAQEAAQDRFDKAIESLKPKIEKTKSLAEDLGLTFASAFEDAIVGGRGLSSVLKGLEQDILRIVARKLITEPLGNSISGAMGGGNAFSSLGSWFSSLFSGGFAEGGFIPPGRWGMTGERGPEPVFGGRTGVTVQPGGMRVVQNFSIAGSVDRRTQQQIAAAAARGLQGASTRLN